jgi:hypothetical protein
MVIENPNNEILSKIITSIPDLMHKSIASMYLSGVRRFSSIVTTYMGIKIT